MSGTNYMREKIRKKHNVNKIDCRTSSIGYICDYVIEECEHMSNEYVDISNINYNELTCRVDCVLNKIKYLKIYGYVRDEHRKSCSGVFVNLFNQVVKNNNIEYLDRAGTITDSIGYFQFVIYRNYDKENYLVKISSGDRLDKLK